MDKETKIFNAIVEELTPNTPEIRRAKAFSELSGISLQVVRHYLSGFRKLGNKNREKLISIGVNPVFIDTGVGDILLNKNISTDIPKNIMRLPVYTNIPCGSPALIFQDEPIEFKTIDKIKGLKNPVILEAKGDSNLPLIRDKDLLVASEVAKPRKGDLVATNFRGADPGTLNTNIKIFQPYAKDTFLLKPINTIYDTSVHQYNEVYNFYKCIRLIRDLY